MTITIRKSQLSDLEVIADFQQRLAFETEDIRLDPQQVKQGVRAMFDDPTKGVYFLAQVNDEVIGCHSITYEWSDWRNMMVWWIQSVYVVEKFRNQGVFKTMFENLKAMIAKDPNVGGLRLYVDRRNVSAQKVYTAMGMNGDHYSVFELMK